MKKEEFSPNIIDNTKGRELVGVIKDRLKKSKEAKFAIGYFFLSGFSLVKEDFPDNYDKLPFLKMVMGNETTYPTKEELVAGYNLRELFKQKMIEELQSRELSKNEIRRLRTLRELIAGNIIDVKLFEKSRMHAKLYLFLTTPKEKYGSPGLGVVGSSNFTAEGLTKNKELNVLLTSREDVLYLNQWFDVLWEEASDFREDLLRVIDISGVLPESPYPKVGKKVDPETLFKYLVYRWFEGRVLTYLNKDVLLEFQLVGVVNSVKIGESYNGVILADSVGLGKSFMASAVIDEFINGKHPSWVRKGKEPAVLLILPPSIINQWEELLLGGADKETKEKMERGEKVKIVSSQFFKKGYLKRVVKNQNNYKIYEIYSEEGMKRLGKIAFMSLGIFQNYKVDKNAGYVHPELKSLAEKYDLFVIDEAHKYRNKNTNRWKAVKELRTKSDGFPNKFLLLTATPLNNSINDIYNLIRLFSDDTFETFRIRGIPITDLIKRYNQLKKKLRKNDDDQVRKDLKKAATEIKQKILDEVMVLRTRKYIMEQFKEIKVDGKPLIFKDPRPYSLDYSPFYTKGYKKLIHLISKGLEKIQFEHTKLYGVRYVVFEEESVDEERAKKHYIEIADLFRLLLGKRLESGIYAFETTLRRIYEKERIFYTIFKKEINWICNRNVLKEVIEKAVKEAKIKKDLEEVKKEYIPDEEEEENWFDRVVRLLLEYAEMTKEIGTEYTEFELFKIGLKKVLANMEEDLKMMGEILKEMDNLKEKMVNGKFRTLGKIPKQEEDIVDLPIFCYQEDPKLEALKQMLCDPAFKSEKLKEIPSQHRKKVIIFTQYKDTAYYLFHTLSDWIKREVDLHTWLLDEDGRAKMGLVTGDTETKTKVNYIKRFAPEANKGYEEERRLGEIKILISTDALSEGVNLQDADAVINYDLPWNPMIIVQRVGRVNRIGNDKDVVVTNFIPSEEIEVIVGVLNKLKEKINDITLVVGKETKILTQEEEIRVETFGEKIKDLSRMKMTDLEEIGISEDFKKFIPEGIPQEQIDEYNLLHKIQYELAYTDKDFEEVIGMKDYPYYSFITGKDKLISVYEFYRGSRMVKKMIMSVDKESGEVSEETPIVFLDLIEEKERGPERMEKVMNRLKKVDEEKERILEELKESYQQEQKGFLAELRKALLRERARVDHKIENAFWNCVNVLQLLPYYTHSKPLKEKLVSSEVVEINKNSEVKIKDFLATLDKITEYLKQEHITSLESLTPEVKHLGWYYEI